MKQYNVVFVSTMPPDRGNLAEYGAYVTEALSKHPKVGRVDVLCNRLAKSDTRPSPTFARTTLHRVWALGSVLSLLRMVWLARALKPDVVHINAGIRTWGKGRLVSMVGAMLPMLMRLMGLRVVTTLHTIGETVRLDEMGEYLGPLTRLGIRMASRFYTMSNAVTVTLHSMRMALQRSVGAQNVVHIAHGTYGARVSSVDAQSKTVLAFGFWGAFKDADLLVRAIAKVRKTIPDAQLVLGGGAHPYFPEIYERLKKDNAKYDYVHFSGYVPEEELGQLFESAALLVMPYRTNAGASGVLNLARSYGKALVISQDQGLLEQINTEGGEASMFTDEDTLVAALTDLLRDNQKRQRQGLANLQVAREVTIPMQVDKMVSVYEQICLSGSVRQVSGFEAEYGAGCHRGMAHTSQTAA